MAQEKKAREEANAIISALRAQLSESALREQEGQLSCQLEQFELLSAERDEALKALDEAVSARAAASSRTHAAEMERDELLLRMEEHQAAERCRPSTVRAAGPVEAQVARCSWATQLSGLSCR